MNNENEFLVNSVFALIHFSWFVVYYSKYSTLNQKLVSIDKMQRAKVITSELAEMNRCSVEARIKGIKRKCLSPNPAIAIAHVVYFRTSGQPVMEQLPAVLGILSGGIVLILMANVVKGRYIFDPAKRFRGNPLD